MAAFKAYPLHLVRCIEPWFAKKSGMRVEVGSESVIKEDSCYIPSIMGGMHPVHYHGSGWSTATAYSARTFREGGRAYALMARDGFLRLILDIL